MTPLEWLAEKIMRCRDCHTCPDDRCECADDATIAISTARNASAETRLRLIRELLPDTHAVVPKKPTDAMVQAGLMTIELPRLVGPVEGRTPSVGMWATKRWTEMLDAAQEPQEAGGDA